MKNAPNKIDEFKKVQLKESYKISFDVAQAENKPLSSPFKPISSRRKDLMKLSLGPWLVYGLIFGFRGLHIPTILASIICLIT